MRFAEDGYAVSKEAQCDPTMWEHIGRQHVIADYAITTQFMSGTITKFFIVHGFFHEQLHGLIICNSVSQ